MILLDLLVEIHRLFAECGCLNHRPFAVNQIKIENIAFTSSIDIVSEFVLLDDTRFDRELTVELVQSFYWHEIVFFLYLEELLHRRLVWHLRLLFHFKRLPVI